MVVQKKDKSIRLCIDYQKLNAATPMDAYPMPRTDELLDRLGDAEYISTLDLARGFLLAGTRGKERQGQDSIHHSKWLISVSSHAIWAQWSPSHLSKDDG